MIRHKTPRHFLANLQVRRSIHISRPRTYKFPYNPREIERPEDSVDVCIVGAGPAGLSAAIRIKQLENEAKERGEIDRDKEVRVVVLEKGSEVGSHILSGGVLEPQSLIDLLGPVEEFESKYGSPAPLTQKAGDSKMIWLTPGKDGMGEGGKSIKIPHPPQMGNKGNYIISLSALTRWLASVAEEHYGVEIYPGFGASRIVYSDDPILGLGASHILGVLTNDVGISKPPAPSSQNPSPVPELSSNFEPGMFFRSRVTLLAEGAHGSLTKGVVRRYDLRKESEGQTYGFGIKEVWRVAPEDTGDANAANPHYDPGLVVHTMGFPLQRLSLNPLSSNNDANTYGGGWVYHLDKGLVSIGLVVGADWENPWRNVYKDFQMMKHHPYLRSLLTHNSSSFTPTRLAYGARTLVEGGLQSLPLLHFPGGALIGDSAGLVNVGKIKGIHNALGSGMGSAEGAWGVLKTDTSNEGKGEEAESVVQEAADLSPYTTSFLNSRMFHDLHEVRNLRPSFNIPFFTKRNIGVLGGIAYSGVDSLILKGRTPWTLRHTKDENERIETLYSAPSLDSKHTGKSDPSGSTGKYREIKYPPFQPPLSTDLMTSVMLTGTSHEEDQPEHLRVLKMDEAEFDEVNSEAQRRRDHVKVNVGEYAGLLSRACPAGVYEYVDDEASKDGSTGGEGCKGKKLVINAQNCIHCKLCDIKVPSQDITWTVPEGGGGPKYSECTFWFFDSFFSSMDSAAAADIICLAYLVAMT
ncbi:hypothetical protein BDP27DRAFT_1388259 [Rhodocollybia butyracea]|uniref:Probable electron transfer flavoprotein-ubiquinone oxidoreductase, mitochondrial n=1 Tax=Rhodocollybia butyracea TaxID=206335 RepID=A0A9P5UGH0_9AGAR|nr:hypothetical protein BDP27DRAFT_1388259 [Rhodocollybia butyracea]